ncbi:MAG: response regulator [Myxococcota bacterium]|jgi:CheY-like chemotaxis protein|nr:response regulator [Myxococcota bacterium]
MSTKGKTILLVDDDVDFVEQQELQLSAMGFDVVKAYSVAEAETLLESVKPDLALLDLMMEFNDGGFVLAYRIRKRYPGTPVIIATNVANETGLEFNAQTNEERSWIKADVMLAKPIRFEQLKREIDRLLGA